MRRIVAGTLACVALIGLSVGPDDALAQAPGSATQTARRATPGNLVGHGGPVKAVRAEAGSRRVLTGGFDYAMMLWDVADAGPKLVRRFDQHGGPVNAVAFVPGGKRALAAADDGVVTLWDIESGAMLHRFEGHQGKVVGIDVAPDGRSAVSAGWDRTARLWDLDALTAGAVLNEHGGPVNAAVFSADGGTIFTASYDGAVRAFARASGALQRRLASVGQSVNALVRIGGGDRLLYGTVHGESAIIDGTTGDAVARLPDVQRPVLALASLDRPGLIATGSGDGLVRVFRAEDAALVEEYRNPFGPVWALALLGPREGEGQQLYYAGLDDFVTLWQVSPRAPFEAVDTSQYPRRFQVAGKADDPVARGELQFARKCSVCHTLTPDGANRAGPTLHKIFGRRIATLPGYPFSAPLRNLDITWTPETVSKLFELGPDVVTPGSKMPLQKMTDATERDALIAFLAVATVDEPAAKPQNDHPKGDRKP